MKQPSFISVRLGSCILSNKSNKIATNKGENTFLILYHSAGQQEPFCTTPTSHRSSKVEYFLLRLCCFEVFSVGIIFWHNGATKLCKILSSYSQLYTPQLLFTNQVEKMSQKLKLFFSWPGQSTQFLSGSYFFFQNFYWSKTTPDTLIKNIYMGLGVYLWWFGLEKVTYIHTDKQTDRHLSFIYID